MERVITFVMGAGIILLLCVGLGWADTQVSVTPINDTYIVTPGTNDVASTWCGNVSNSSVNKGLWNNLSLWCKAGVGNYYETLMKFNITTAQSKIIKNLSFSYHMLESGGSSLLTLYFSYNNSWVDTSKNSGTIDSNGGIAFKTFQSSNLKSVWNTTYTPLNETGVSFLSYVYNSTDGIITLFNNNSDVGGTGTNFSFNSMDSAFSPMLNFTLIDYLSGNVSITDLTGLCLDFESGSYNDNATSVSDCTGSTWDLFYDLTTNKITPIEPIAFAGRTTSDSNASLGSLDCNLFGPSAYTYNQYTNVNPPATPKLYDMFCFNQSYVHAVKGFYGAIKIVNNTNVRYSLECPLNDCPDLDLYWAIYSPSFATFSAPVLQPNPPIAGINLTVQWTTTIPMYGGVYFRYNVSGNMSSYYTVYDSNTSYRTTHLIVIPASYILSYKYEYYLIGNGSTGSNYTSIMFNFTALGVTELITENTTIAGSSGALQRLVDAGLVSDYNQAKWFFGGLIILIMGGFAFWFGGMKIGMVSTMLLLLALSTVGLLPGFVLLPVIAVAVLVIITLLQKVFI